MWRHCPTCLYLNERGQSRPKFNSAGAKILSGVQTPQVIYGRSEVGLSLGIAKQAVGSALDELQAKWGQQYPMVIQLWRRKWENLSA